MIDSILIRALTFKQIILWSYQVVRNRKVTKVTVGGDSILYYGEGYNSLDNYDKMVQVNIFYNSVKEEHIQPVEGLTDRSQ